MKPNPLLRSIAVGAVVFIAANAAESALIAVTGGGLRLLEWTSDAVLSSALVAATYLWLRVQSLRGALTALERSRVEVETELRLAAAIQRHLLAAADGRPSPVAWCGRLEPARRVGGDFYDAITLPGGSVLILTADVSGKGVPAVLALASARAAFRHISPSAADLPALASALSRAIFDDNGGTPYMTAILCQIDPAKGELRYLNAGHPAGRLAGPGRLLRLESTGPPLGLLPQSRWTAHTLDARPFSLGLFFTDGVVEALEADVDPDAILDDLAQRLVGQAPEAACAALMERVHATGNGAAAPPDDRTVFAFVPAGSGVGNHMAGRVPVLSPEARPVRAS